MSYAEIKHDVICTVKQLHTCNIIQHLSMVCCLKSHNSHLVHYLTLIFSRTYRNSFDSFGDHPYTNYRYDSPYLHVLLLRVLYWKGVLHGNTGFFVSSISSTLNYHLCVSLSTHACKLHGVCGGVL
jgi:hypothetical protein